MKVGAQLLLGMMLFSHPSLADVEANLARTKSLGTLMRQASAAPSTCDGPQCQCMCDQSIDPGSSGILCDLYYTGQDNPGQIANDISTTDCVQALRYPPCVQSQ